MKYISRYGAYGLIIHEEKVLLSQKKSGPYEKLWGLPGGAIEFGEDPRDTLIREIQEETSFHAKDLSIYSVESVRGSYRVSGEIFSFHHIGIIYEVGFVKATSGGIAEENYVWEKFDQLKLKKLTPFAAKTLKQSSGKMFGSDN